MKTRQVCLYLPLRSLSAAILICNLLCVGQLCGTENPAVTERDAAPVPSDIRGNGFTIHVKHYMYYSLYVWAVTTLPSVAIFPHPFSPVQANLVQVKENNTEALLCSDYHF